MPYNIPVLKELVKRNCEVTFVHNNKDVKYIPQNIEGVKYYDNHKLTYSDLNSICEIINPNIIIISDRTITNYNILGTKYKKDIPVICGNDTQWRGGRQWINVITSFFRHKIYYSHMLVAGMRQFEYAKKLGFDNEKIVWPLYSADTEEFTKLPLSQERFKFTKDILFVGRLNKVKGIEYLIRAWEQVENKDGGKLHIVGSGNHIEIEKLPNDVKHYEFSDQKLLRELALKCKAFILPSIFEPWGVVIHEFASAGMPIIASNVCGSASHFVINNFNGKIIKPQDVDSTKNAITFVYNQDPKELYSMGVNSRKLSESINPQLVAAAILSTITN